MRSVFRMVYLRFLASSRQAPAAVMAITPAAAALLPVAGDFLEVLFLVVPLVLLFAVVFSAFFLVVGYVGSSGSITMRPIRWSV